MLAVVIIPSIMLGAMCKRNGRYKIVVQLDAAAKKKEGACKDFARRSACC